MGIVEHQKKAKALDSAIKRLQKEADHWQKRVFPRGTEVYVVSDIEAKVILCRVVSHYGGLENANRVIVEAIDPTDIYHFANWRHVRESWYVMPIVRVMLSEAAAEYTAVVEQAGL